MDLYAICPMDMIPVGGATPFDLAELDSEGNPRPLRIVIVRKTPTDYRCYVNTCPHDGAWLNIGSGGFFDASGAHLRCGKHGALFAIDSGICLDGPCQGERLRAIPAETLRGDVCISGVRLLEDEDFHAASDDPGETMEIMIHPD